jgi:hypothetical protein
MDKAKAFLLALEAERHDTSWRKRPNLYEPSQPIVVKTKAVDPIQQRERDRAMFNAGRFSMGARDDEAVQAHLLVSKLIKKTIKIKKGN